MQHRGQKPQGGGPDGFPLLRTVFHDVDLPHIYKQLS
jgi:hypothetical protein